ncbi:MAG: hypothetical protein IT463_11440 [Planctomycetes bacterium]|nr:hypothetical protein [Planctomycetota bacterium]
MANILITDIAEESAYLVRSILRGFGHAVSISIARADAEAKLATGLFDLLVMDFGTVAPDNVAVVRFANEMLPGLPVVALTRPEQEKQLKGLQITGRFQRPVRGRQVKDVVTAALAAGAVNRRGANRLHADLPISLNLAGVSFASRTIDLSSRGVAVDTTDVKLSPEQMEAIEGAVGASGAQAELTLAEGKVLRLNARLAFVERHRSLSGRTIGLAFEALDVETEVALAGMQRMAA